jgi:hypothetical protein
VAITQRTNRWFLSTQFRSSACLRQTPGTRSLAKMNKFKRLSGSGCSTSTHPRSFAMANLRANDEHDIHTPNPHPVTAAASSGAAAVDTLRQDIAFQSGGADLEDAQGECSCHRVPAQMQGMRMCYFSNKQRVAYHVFRVRVQYVRTPSQGHCQSSSPGSDRPWYSRGFPCDWKSCVCQFRLREGKYYLGSQHKPRCRAVDSSFPPCLQSQPQRKQTVDTRTITADNSQGRWGHNRGKGFL